MPTIHSPAVDSHCHVSPIWFEPVESLLFQMDRHFIAQAVLVQLIGQVDNSYQQACVAQYPGRFGSVVWIDPASPDAADSLLRLADQGATGIRLRPGARSPGADPLAIWRLAAQTGLAVSCVGNSAAFAAEEFASLVAALPQLPIVLEHLGGTSQPDLTDADRKLRARVFRLADYPNVMLKLPGLGELMPRAEVEQFDRAPVVPAVLAAALDAFGSSRLMWGSDFPPVCAREGFANARRLAERALETLQRDHRNSIFGGLASKVFCTTRNGLDNS